MVVVVVRKKEGGVGARLFVLPCLMTEGLADVSL